MTDVLSLVIGVVIFASGVLLGAWLMYRKQRGASPLPWIPGPVEDEPSEDGEPIPEDQRESY